MLNRCNASCISSARRSLHEQHETRPNPHLLGGRDTRQRSRAMTFLPVFLLVLMMVIGYGLLYTFYGSTLTAWQERAEESFARLTLRLGRRYPRLEPLLSSISAATVGSAMICFYYINEGLTVVQTHPLLARLVSLFIETDGVWHYHVVWIDATNLAGAAAAVLCIAKWKPMYCAYVMLADTLVDSQQLLWHICRAWLSGRGLYINELMAKKFSLLGCVGLMIATQQQARERSSSFAGGLLEGAALSNQLSLAVLAGRLLIASLFLYVGLNELHRLLFEPFTPYLPGDGHDVVWPKAVELLLSVPFILGFETAAVSRLLALSLVLEAFYAWSWWWIPGNGFSYEHHRRAIHYREHFVTNLATAGGLLLLQKIGAGKYSVDELLKKTD